jgi:kynurenine formamidase
MKFRKILLPSSAAMIVAATYLAVGIPAGVIAQEVAPPSLVSGFEIVELTHVLNEKFPYIPVPGVTFPFSKHPIATIEKAGVAANSWTIHEHLGTQIDAPNHFILGGVGLDALQARDLIVPVVVIDYREQARADRDAALSVDQIKQWEAQHGKIPAGAAVALYTGWDSKVGTDEFLGLDGAGKKHFPGFSAASLEFLASERNIWGVGVDTISFDPGPDDNYLAHKALLGRGKWALEALRNLDALPAVGATIFVGAPRVEGATGGPARVIALVPKSPALAVDGRWQSRNPEALGVGGFLTRDFRFEGNKWLLEYTLFADAAGKSPMLTGRVGGTFAVSSAPGLSGAYPVLFHFDYRQLAPLNAQMEAALAKAGCGKVKWRRGAFQDVTATGCAAVRVPALADCPTEFDLAVVDGDILRLGARTAGSLCGWKMRAQAATAAPLDRVK